MESIISALRDVLGEPPATDGAMIEYVIAGVLLLVVVSSVFKFLMNLVK